MNDFLEYYILPTEQMIIDQMKRYLDVVANYERIQKQNQAILEQIVKNQADVISAHCEQIQLYDEYIQKKKTNSIDNYNPFKVINNNDNINFKSNANKKKHSKKCRGSS